MIPIPPNLDLLLDPENKPQSSVSASVVLTVVKSTCVICNAEYTAKEVKGCSHEYEEKAFCSVPFLTVS